MNLTLLYEDDHLLAVEKPAGLLSVPGRGPDKSDCAVSRAAAEFGWVREVHRLDQPTSGVLLLARNPDAHRRLSAAFAARNVEKRYTALVGTKPDDPRRRGVVCRSGRITVHQRLDPKNRPRQIVDFMQGKEAITDWRVIDAPGTGESGIGESGAIRLELHPITGRTHQLRLALSVCGAPILGDELYAPPVVRSAAPRLMLHAGWIRFPHPKSGGIIEVVSIPEF